MKLIRILTTVILFAVLVKSENINVLNLDAKDSVPNYRLPNETYPEHYHIKLTTNFQTGERDFQGETIIDIAVVNDTRHIVLHARELEILSSTILNAHTGVSENLSNAYEAEREFLILTRSEEKWFDAGTKWILNITYNGQLQNDLVGFFLSRYTDANNEKRYYVGTHLESTSARQAFPCYDEPAKRANITVTINHSPQYFAISNMPVNTDLSSAGKTVFLTASNMPVYLVAFVVSDFGHTELELNGLTQRVYSRPSNATTHLLGMKCASLFTVYFSDYFDIKFMLPKLDHVALPNMVIDPMENWGLIIYPERRFIYNGPNFSEDPATKVAVTIAHEVVHQWFGNYITMQWWTYLWVKEGFATLFSYKALDYGFPEWCSWELFLIREYQGALDTDYKDSSRPMTHYVQTPNEIAESFDTIAYGKSASVLHMWNNVLTENVFQAGVRNFLKTNNYGAAGEKQLFDSLQAAVEAENLKIPATVRTMMETWTHQAGVPLLTVTRNYEDGTFSIKQESYHDNHDNEILEKQKTWYVPINYAVASNPDFSDTKATHYLLNVTEMTVSETIANGDWLIINKQSAYYYRTKYDKNNYIAITECLLSSPFQIPSLNRAQLLNDAHSLVESKRLDHAVLFKMLTYLKGEVEYAPWETAFSILSFYNTYLLENEHYKLFVADLVSGIYKNLGVVDIPDEHHLNKFIRKRVINLACVAELEECLTETSSKLKTFIKNPKSIQPNLQHLFLTFGLRKSEDVEFNYFFDKLMATKGKHILYPYYMSYSRNKAHLNKLLSATIDMNNSLKPQYRTTILSHIYSNNEMGLLACIEFLDKNWEAYARLENYFEEENPLDSNIRSMAEYVVSQTSAEKLSALVDKVKNSQYVATDLMAEVSKKMETNLQWQNDHGQHIISWISKYRSNNS